MSCNMSYICMICTLNIPPLLPLAIEHRRLLEALVSPTVYMADLKACHLLLCVGCQVKMLSVHQFQKTAIQGISNLKYLLSKVTIAPSFPPIIIEDEDVKPEIVTIKIEPGTILPGTEEDSDTNDSSSDEEMDIKTEPQHPLEAQSSQPDDALKRKSHPEGVPKDKCKSVREPSEQPTTSVQPTILSQTPVTKGTISRSPENTSKPKTGKYGTRILRSSVRKRYKVKLRPKPSTLQCPHCDQKLSHSVSLQAHIKSHETTPKTDTQRKYGLRQKNTNVSAEPSPVLVQVIPRRDFEKLVNDVNCHERNPLPKHEHKKSKTSAQRSREYRLRLKTRQKNNNITAQKQKS
ncbi:uncharacterized protein LOC125239422 [Leguminivora glycinivorella]|uniref:uncharacterized protein LOC125239422 n=1 Tax=Leguminivora glycinivorella TaxID=1035111 RepID=UPI00200F13A5|nr:uncharacterized protein LOC125239422 [Leguminivora glycinivorella]